MFGNGKKKKDGNAKNSAKGTKRPNSQSASTKASKESQTQQKQRKRAATNRSFDETTTTITIRRGVIDSCIKKKEAHLAERKKAGKSQCAQGFMKQMIEEVKEKCPALDIQKDDIENEIKRREGEKEKKRKSNKAAKTNPPKKCLSFKVVE